MITAEEYRNFLIDKYVNPVDISVFIRKHTLFDGLIEEIDTKKFFNISWGVGPISEQIDVPEAIKRHKKVLAGLKKLRRKVCKDFYIEDAPRYGYSTMLVNEITVYIAKIYHILAAIIFEHPETIKDIDPKDLKMIREYQSNRFVEFKEIPEFENPVERIDRFTGKFDRKLLVEFLNKYGDEFSDFYMHKKSNWGESRDWGSAGEWRTNDDEDIEYGILGYLREILGTSAKNDEFFKSWLQDVSIDAAPEDLRNIISACGIITDREEVEKLDGVSALNVIWDDEAVVWDSLFHKDILDVPTRLIRAFVSCTTAKR